MKMSIAAASFLVLGTGAASVGAALPNPYKGSDTLFDLTNAAIAAQNAITPGSITGTYAGGGSGGGEVAMVGGLQSTAPMSRAMGTGACGTSTLDLTKASGYVIALDGVSVWGEATAANGAANATGCNNPSGGGLKHDATATGWKSVLKLIYFGETVAFADGISTTVCNGPNRTALVANWSNIFNNACSPNAACPAGLLHAYRRDDLSGTADVFAAVVGGSPNVSPGGVHNFGVSPYCNAMNWDTSTANNNCALGVAKQYTANGGVPVSGDETHRTPPPGAFGDTSTTAPGTQPAVFPVEYQDNDPIRRPCVGLGNGAPARAGEQVCNTDGKLGLVLPIPAVDRLPPAGADPYPSGNVGCNGIAAAGFCGGPFILVAPPTVFKCANRVAPLNSTFQATTCPNNDTLFGGQCFVPTNAGGSAVCENQKVNTPVTCAAGAGLCGTDGREYNLHMFTAAGGYQTLIASGAQNLPFTGHFGRIHMTQTLPTSLGANSGCEMLDASDQIGCLAHADQCSIGFAGLGAANWNTHAVCATPASNIDNELINGIAATPTTVRNFGNAGAYPISRKLYFNSVPGFSAASVTSDELALGTYEATNDNFEDSLVPAGGFFSLLSSPTGQTAGGNGKPFCEDFNEAMLCSRATNTAACPGNGAVGLPTAATTCGNGIRESYEECDCSDGIAADGSPSTDPQCTAAGANGLKNGAAPNLCSTTCRLN